MTPPTTYPRPLLIYGTAWKEDKTAELTKEALVAGFHAVDTANYPTAYNEPLTGDGTQAAILSGIKREDLFIQTKFTPLWAHDKNAIPFRPDQDVEAQIRESIEQSFDHLKVDYLDALFLHAPFEDDADNVKAWKVFETYVPHRIRRLGVSNFALPQLTQVYEAATVKPALVQNRFHRPTSFDADVRAFCADKGLTYQAFWMLAHNPEIMASELVSAVAARLAVEKELAFYLLILGLGGTQVLCGTTNPGRMERNLRAVADFASDQAVRDALQPEVEAFRRLLQELTPQDGEGTKM